jgi:SNF2 family DNA or RNA helicase
MENKVKFIKIGGTPAFYVQGNPKDSWERVFGAQYAPSHRSWIFPGYQPFLDAVVRDIKEICAEALEEEEEAKAYTNARTLEYWNGFVREHPTVGKYDSYDHQLTGTAELLTYYRWYLRWEMGTGKTKVVLDALFHLREKAVVICPLIAVDNWVREADIHTSGALSTITITGTAKQKERKILEAVDKDIVIVSYDTARLYGVPVLCSKAAELKKKERMGSTPAHMRVVDKVATLPEDKQQIHYLAAYYAGNLTPVQIEAEVDKIVGPTPPFLSSLDFKVLVLDEAHRVKSIKSQRTKVITALSAKATRRYMLSGTPTIGDPRDFYTQLKILHPALMPEQWFTFVKKFCEHSKWNEHVVTGYKNMHIINARVNTVSSERKLLDCVQLPEQRDQDVLYYLSAGQTKDYNKAVKEFSLEGEGGKIDLSQGSTRLGKLLQICSGFYYVPKEDENAPCDQCPSLQACFEAGITPGDRDCVKDSLGKNPVPSILFYGQNPKLDALGDLLEDILETEGHKVIIWAHFTAELNHIEELLKKNKYGYVRVDGSNTKNIKHYENLFQNDKGTRVYLSQVNTGIAITLTAAQYSIYYSRPWSPDAWFQSRARNFRIGQKSKTVVYRLVGAHTVEQQQLIALANRQNIGQMLTTKMDCLLCSNYQICLDKGIEPWTTLCKYSSSMDRLITQPKLLPTNR